MMRCRSRRCEVHGAVRGFTLLEVLIALALIAALLGSLFGFYFNLLQSRTRIAAHADSLRGAELLIEHIEQALMFSIAGDGKFGSGIAGTNERITILTRGVAPSISAEASNLPLFDLQRVEIQTAANGAATMRRQPVELRSGSPEPGGALAEQLGMVRFRYHDGSAWRDQFDALQHGSLPRAVEVAIWFKDPRPPDPVTGEVGSSDDEAEENLFEDDLPADESDMFDPLEDDMFDDALDEQWPLPDRYRIIVVPDAGEAAPSDELEAQS